MGYIHRPTGGSLALWLARAHRHPLDTQWLFHPYAGVFWQQICIRVFGKPIVNITLTPIGVVLLNLLMAVVLAPVFCLLLRRRKPLNKLQPAESLNHKELRTVVSAAGAHIPQTHLDMLLRVMDMDSTTVEDIMIPRNQLVGLDLDDDWNELEEQITNSNFTRLLVYRESLDNVIGFVHLRKLLPLFRDGHLDKERFEASIRPAYFIPESTPLTQQLINFKTENRRIALVVDEYGEILGLVALEDILEEIVGEFSSVPSSQSHEIRRMADGSYWVDGSIPIRDINREVGSNFTSAEANTINGLILEYLESIPVPGMTMLIDDYPLEIRKTRNNAVKTLIIHPQIQRKAADNDE